MQPTRGRLIGTAAFAVLYASVFLLVPFPPRHGVAPATIVVSLLLPAILAYLAWPGLELTWRREGWSSLRPSRGRLGSAVGAVVVALLLSTAYSFATDGSIDVDTAQLRGYLVLGILCYVGWTGIGRVGSRR